MRFLLLSFVLINSVVAQKFDNPSNYSYLGSNNILHGILSNVSSDKTVNSKCSEHLNSIWNGIKNREIWALKGKYKRALSMI